MTQWLIDQATNYGYLAVFLGVAIESLGIPVPGETSLVIGVVVATQGHLSVPLVSASGFAGAVAGGNIGYLFGRRWGDQFVGLPILRRFYQPHRVAAAEKFFERRGVYAVFFGRFVAILRIFAGPLAGMHRMRWSLFTIANAAGSVLWVALVTTVGVLVGKNLNSALSILARIGYGGLILAAVLAIAATVLIRRNRRKTRVS